MRGCAVRQLSLSIAACALACLALQPHASAAASGQGLIEHMEQRFGLNERQVRGALGALLVFVREQVPEPEFRQFAEAIPNADHIMQQVKLQGVVTRPLDDIDDYEASLASVGIGQPLASQIAPAVLEYLGGAGFERQYSLLERLLD
jgi:Protein of unknown function VcgC/VcgE (DUF2780)